MLKAHVVPEKEDKMIGLERQQKLRLLSLCVVIIVCHTATSYLEETLFKHLHYKSPFFMVLVMCALYVILFIAWKLCVSTDKKLIPPSIGRDGDRSVQMALLVLCLSYAMANSLTKLSLRFVSVPTQIVFKSCKLVAVMLGSTVILKKSYTRAEYLIALGLVAGMVSFALADLKDGAATSLRETDMSAVIGLSILMLALCFDSVLGNLQEKFQKSKICDENVLMFLQSMFSATIITIYTAFSGELVQGLTHCWTDVRVFVCLSIWGLLNSLGTIALLKVAGEFSAVTAVLTAFIRKFFSLLFSYLLYPKPFNMGHAMGLALVFGSVSMHARHKQKQKKQTASTASTAEHSNGSGSTHTTSAGGEKGGDEEMGALLHENSSYVFPTSPRTSSIQSRPAPPSPQLRAAPTRLGA